MTELSERKMTLETMFKQERNGGLCYHQSQEILFRRDAQAMLAEKSKSNNLFIYPNVGDHCQDRD